IELAAHETPMVLCYRVSPLLYGIGRLVVKVPHIGLVNLVAGREVVPEHVGVRSAHAALASDLAALWLDDGRRTRMKADLREVRERLAAPGSYDRTAGRILDAIRSWSDPSANR
ncbi:MAG: lipid-A-disaccharide synthase, partial [Planctomycetes bacterium]|nr:lipid-A-disaccharide synthase [Planctomycetota bacterium]